MKALVISNCATSGYVRGLQALCPEWTVAGAMTQTVQQWTRDRQGAELRDLAAYSRDTDLVICLEKDDVLQLLELRPGVMKIAIPAFGFKGLHPDSFHLEGTTSVLGAGNVSSKIVVAGYLLHKTIDETAACFRADVYERLGYLDIYDADKQRVLEKFRRREIDLADDFSRWEAQGRFLYTYNHPMKNVLFDILRRALQGRLLTADEAARSAEKVAQVEDTLASSIVWPIYPEIGRRLRICEPIVWRKGKANGYELLDLRQFIRLTFDGLQRMKELTPAVVPEFETYAAVLSH